MRIGILGSGLMGGKLGTIFARAGHEVVFSYARSNENSRSSRATRKAMHAPARRARPRRRRTPSAGRALVADRRCAEAGGRPVGQGDPDLLAADECGQYGTHHWHDLVGSRRTRKESSHAPRSSPRSTPCRAKCCSACSKPSARPRGRAWCTAATTRVPKMSRPADPMTRFRSGGCRLPADRPIHRAVRAARRRTRIRGEGGPELAYRFERFGR